MISFIMMAHNVDNYISDAITELQKEHNIDWELVVVDDFSTDDTFKTVSKLSYYDNRIKLVRNLYKGKVTGTNYGYTFTNGDIIKCIDSDDILKCEFFKEYHNMSNYDAHCHDAIIVNDKLDTLALYRVNNAILSKPYESILNNLSSLPKAYWSFNRKIADKIFPMPDELPFEDVWITLNIKKYSESIYYMDKPLYLYRQHSNQVYGGILNYNLDNVVFRANRLIKLITLIESNQQYLVSGIDKPFYEIKKYLSLIDANTTFFQVICSGISVSLKVKLILLLFSPKLMMHLTMIKWSLDGVKNKIL